MISAIDKIAECDKELSLLRDSWLSGDPSKQGSWMKLINKSLDERLRLMRMRDSEKSAAPTS